VYASISRSLLPYNRSLLPYNRSLLPYDRSLLTLGVSELSARSGCRKDGLKRGDACGQVFEGRQDGTGVKGGGEGG